MSEFGNNAKASSPFVDQTKLEELSWIFTAYTDIFTKKYLPKIKIKFFHANIHINFSLWHLILRLEKIL